MRMILCVKRFAVGLAVASTIVFFSGCSPAAPVEQGVGDDADGVAQSLTVEWSKDADCSACHVMEQGLMGDPACLAGSHAERGVECLTCHADEEGLEAVHEGATTAPSATGKLKKTAVSGDVCATCHDQAELAEAVAGSVELEDAEGTKANPHFLPANEEHAGIECVDCHKAHECDADVRGAARETCTSCHHAGVFACYTCHE